MVPDFSIPKDFVELITQQFIANQLCVITCNAGVRMPQYGNLEDFNSIYLFWLFHVMKVST